MTTDDAARDPEHHDLARRQGARRRQIGDRIADIKAAYPEAKVNNHTEDIFGISLVRIPKNAGGKIALLGAGGHEADRR